MGQKKQRPSSLDTSIVIRDHGVNKLNLSYFRTLMESSPSKDEIIIGVDEAGRGPVFGPMVITACANPLGWFMPGIKDSKLIKKESVRKGLANEIQHATVWASAIVSASAINQHGTLNAVLAAGQKVAREVVARIQKAYPGKPIKLIFDGRDHPEWVRDGVHQVSIEKADATVFEVSCASIISKVLHDNLVHEIVQSDVSKYGKYDLDRCVGYGTPKHKAALLEFGLTDQHRTVACRTLMRAKDETRKTSSVSHSSGGPGTTTAA